MKNETKGKLESITRFTPKTLQNLKDRGFRYVQIKALTHDNHQDYMKPNYFLLVPIKDLSNDPDKMEIYEPISSEILIEWSNSPDDNIKVVVAAGL